MKSAKLYAIHSSCGIVKFGVATNIKLRWRALRHSKMIAASSFMSTPIIENGCFAAEKKLLGRASKILTKAFGSEFFYCSDFGIARNLLKQTHREFSDVNVGWREYYGCNPVGKEWTKAVRKIKKDTPYVSQALNRS